ncbi:MAG TPA: TIGR03943 family protein [Anaerolineales bacterium]|nr:TIGR03943 family protein [Anaerolineales bacterium]
MPPRLYRSFQALLLLGLFLFLMGKVINNQLLWYINQRFVILAQIGIVFLAILAQRLFTEVKLSRERQKAEEQEHNHHHDDDHDHAPAAANLWIMLIPLLIGVLIPARPLDSSAVSAKGITTSSALVSSQSSSSLFETESEQRNVLDWVKIFYFEKDLNPFIGQQASVVGFVYRDESLPQGQFLVSRFILSCCAADGYAVGMIVDSPQADSLEKDTWIKVSGPIDVVSFNGNPSPLIHAETIEVVPQPDQPYLYP